MTDFHHVPVMADRIVEIFRTVPAGTLVDATVGGGGHARLLLESRPDLTLVGIDRDETALAAAAEVLAPFGDRVTLRHARFDHLDTVMTDLKDPPVSGVLFDLGVSSPQLDQGERGFSYRNEGPLDMRMDRNDQWSAADIVNGFSEIELVRVLQEHGEERFAIRIASAIVSNRPIETTAELAAIVRDAIPAAGSPAGWPSGQAHLPGAAHRGQP